MELQVHGEFEAELTSGASLEVSWGLVRGVRVKVQGLGFRV